MIVEAAFVLTAIGIEHQVTRTLDFPASEPTPLGRRVLGPWRLSVPISQAASATSHLDSYWRENVKVAQRPPAGPAVDSGMFGALAYLLVIWGLPWLQAWTLFDWRGSGTMVAQAVVAGEWWRTFTALTLHGDLGHIAGNSLFGVLFGSLLARQLGSGVGWLMVLVAAAGANGINAYSQGTGFRSLGASTAVFAALGILGALVWRRGYYFRYADWRRSFAPVFAAICLVAFTGVGDANTDVAAHLFGFIVGLAVGLASAALPFSWLNNRNQLIAGGAAFGLIALSWSLALSS